MLKKFLSIILALLMTISLFSGLEISSFAEENDILSNLTYEINDGEVKITDCESSISGDVVIPDTIEGYPVTEIADYAFIYCDFNNVTIPASVRTIGYDTFWDCRNLKSFTVDTDNEYYSSDEYGVLFNSDKTELLQYPKGNERTEYSIPESVKTIAQQSFYSCTNLECVNIPEGVTKIDYEAFFECSGLKTVSIPASVTTIEEYAFSGCENISAFTVDNDNKYYSSDEYGVLFNRTEKSLMYYPRANSRTEYSIPSRITTIADGAFSWCNNLETIVISASVTDIITSFSYCDNLKVITVDENNKYYSSADGVLYDKSKTEIICYPANKSGAEFRIPDSVWDIAYNAFFSCRNLESVIIPESISYIDVYYDFYLCENLEKITFLDPFCDIYSLGNLPIICGYPGSTAQEYAETLGREFVSICNHNYRLVVKKPTCTEEGYTTFNCSVCGSFEGKYEQPIGHISNDSDVYCDNCGYRIYYHINTDEIITVDVEYGFESEIYVKYIPEKTGVYRFYSMADPDDSDAYISGALYNSQMRQISGCFDYNDDLNFIIEYKLEAGEIYYFGCEYFGDSTSYSFDVALIERDVLDCLYYEIVDNEAVITDCDFFAVGDIEIPETIEGYPVTTIADGAFWKCYAVESISFPASVSSIGMFYKGEHYTVGDCNKVSAFTVDENNEHYSSDEYGVLFNKDKTELIRYPEGNERTEYTIPDSVTTIGEYAFFQCKNLENIIMPDSVKTICASAFSNISSNGKLKSLTLGKNVETIGENVFHYCMSLESITLPEKLITIGSDAFMNCTSLKSVTIPASVTKIESNAFVWCPAIESFTVDEDNEYYSNDEYGALFNKDKTEMYYYPPAADCTEYRIPEGVVFIYYAAFYDNENLERVSVPDSVKNISTSTDHEDTYPDYIWDDSYRLFAYCENLVEITVDENNEYFSSEDGIFYNKDKTRLIRYPAKKSGVDFTIPDTVTVVGEDAFTGCVELRNVTVSAGVTQIKHYAFNEINNLESITILNPFCNFYYYDYGVLGCASVIYGYPGSTAERFAEYNDCEFVSLCNHNPEITIVDATCITDGYASFRCDICGSFESVNGEAFGHYDLDFDDYCDSCGAPMFYFINAGETITVDASGYIPAYIKFIPEETGIYRFYSQASDDTLGAVAIETGTDLELISIDEDGNGDFLIECELVAGNTYIFMCMYENETMSGSFDVTLEKKPHAHEAEALVTGLYDADNNDICDICGENLFYHISAGETLTIDISWPGAAYVKFTPEETGIYKFYSQNADHGLGAIFDSDWNLLESGGDGNGNFSIEDKLVAGNTYILCCAYASLSMAGSYDVTVEKTSEYTPHPGDVDMDGRVTAADGRLALRAGIGVETISDEAFINADVDGDGMLTVNDCRLIWRVATKLNTDFENDYETRESTPNIYMTWTVNNLNQVIVHVYAENIADTCGGDVSFSFDPAVLDFVKITCSNISENGHYGTGGDFGNEIKHSFVWLEHATEDGELFTITFNKLKDQETTIEFNPINWFGTYKPAGSSVTIGSTEHDYVAVITPPTCTTQGYTTYTCACGESYVDDYTDTTDHDTEHVMIPSTCTVAGIEFDICTTCAESLNTNVLPLAEHTKEIIIGKDATCTETGLTDGEKCSVCNEILVVQEIVPETEHISEVIPGKEATCTETGLTDGEKCFVCGIIIKEQEEIPVTGHTFGEWIETKAPTYIEFGELTRECVCGEKETQEIEKLEADKEVVDKNTNIAIKYPNDTYEGDIELSVVEQFDGESYQIINNEKSDFKYKLFDISTLVGGEKVQPNGLVLIGVPLPEGYNAEKTFVYFVNNKNGKTEKMNSYYEDGYIWFEASHFSPYAIVDESEKVDKPVEPEYILGDVNGDEKVTAADARIVLRAGAKLETLAEKDILAADVNKDSKITAADARTILRVSAKLESFD